MAAGADERDDDMVAGPDVVDPRPDLAHHAGGLVAVDGGQLTAPAAVGEDDVAVADGAGGEVDRDLAGTRRIERDLFDDQRFPERPTDRSLHTPTPADASPLPPHGPPRTARIESPMHQGKRSFIVVRPKPTMVSRWPTVCPR